MVIKKLDQLLEQERVQKKKVAQRQRLLHEFPWLWAVQSLWTFNGESDEIRVTDNLKELRTIGKMRSEGDIQAWMLLVCDYYERVEKIRFWKDACWAENMFNVSHGECTKSIVIGCNSPTPYAKNFTIYRVKNNGNLNILLSEIIKEEMAAGCF